MRLYKSCKGVLKDSFVRLIFLGDVINFIKLGNEIIGIFTNYIDENNESVISLFYIDKKYQNRGIGTDILKKQFHILK